MAKRLPLRIVLDFRGTGRKLCTLHVGADNSFYIHSYRPSGTPWCVPGGTGQTDASGRIQLDFKKFISPPFSLHKISYHPSGFIHLTNTEGKRYRDGVRGPAFSEMKLPYDFCIIAPCDPGLLPGHARERGFVVRIALTDDIAPFYVTLTIIDAGAPPPPAQGPLIVQPVNVIFPACALGIALTMWPVKGATEEAVPVWPPFPFFLYRLAA
jgi:hypothetical protein